MVYLFNVIISLITKYGAVGFGLANLVLVVYFGHKLFTNHLAHMAKDIKSTTKLIGTTNKKIDSLSKITHKNAERISHIEGQLDK